MSAEAQRHGAALLAPFLERDADAIRAVMREQRQERSPDELFGEAARLAVLSFAPSQHSKHALIACRAAMDVRDTSAERWSDLVAECVVYASESRQPWSEPPILDPPHVSPDQPRGIGELRAAVAMRDRLRGERWLSARIDDPDLARDYFTVASDDFEDLGHKLIVAVAAWKLAASVPEVARFAVLRTAVWEMVAYADERYRDSGHSDEPVRLMDRLVADAVEESGSLVAMHSIFLLDAAVEAAAISGDEGIVRRTSDFLAAHIDVAGAPSAIGGLGAPATIDAPPLEPYRLACDYGAFLKAHAVAGRWRTTNPSIDAAVAAAKQNLDDAPSFEEWSFA